MENEKFDYLLDKYLKGELDSHQNKLVEAWLDSVRNEESTYDWSGEEINNLYDEIKLEKSSVRRIKWAYWVAAASILFIGLFSVYFLQKKEPKEELILASQILPVQDSVVLITGDGEQIYLDHNTASVQLANNTISDSEGRELNKAADKIEMYQLHIPKGRQFKIELEDGTKVWLNAGAKLKYPSKFDDNYREVELEGEAYFEVAKQVLPGGDNNQSRRKPFFVRSSKQVISVLGTHFNIEANKGEEYSLTSLVEGSVEVIKTNKESKTLKPGEQSMVNEKNAIKIVPVDLEMVLGWKNNLFVFHNSSLREIFQEVERWYDIKVEIDKWPAEKFYGEIQRNSPLSEVLKLIEMSSNYRFKIVNDGVERRLLMQ